MAGPEPSIANVPLREVLPPAHLAAEDQLRTLATVLDQDRSAVGRTAWHWYPAHAESPRLAEGRLYLLLVDATITLYNAGDDWLELTLDIAWREPQQLTVNASVQVACWCPQDHNMHEVREAQWPVAESHELVERFAAGVAMLAGVLDSGPFEPGPWRISPNLPDAPVGKA
jgi:hypothetical protein